MDGLLAILASFALAAIFAAVAVRFGADSRQGYGDDHARTR